MAAIRNRNGKWQVRITRKGQKPIARTFLKKLMRKSGQDKLKQAWTQVATLVWRLLKKQLSKRYLIVTCKKLSPNMRGAKEDLIRLKAIARHPIAQQTMTNLTASKIAEYRDERLKTITSGTVIRELAYFSSISNIPRQSRGALCCEPLKAVNGDANAAPYH